MTVSTNSEAILKNAIESLKNGLTEFADGAENLAVLDSYGVWQDDTGSSRASITGYSIGVQPYDKNFQNAEWQAAQARGSLKYGTHPSNFKPHVEDVDVDSEVGVILTMFVEYAEKVGGHEVLGDAADSLRNGFESAVAGYLKKVL